MTTRADDFQKALARSVQRADGWANALTGIGHAMRDKSMSTLMFAERVEREQAESIWRGDDMGARIIETIPHEMLREGFEVRIQDDESSAAELLMGKCEDLGLHTALQEALEYERAYGGGAILIGANDGATDLRVPLNEDGILSLDWLTVLSSFELHPTRYYSNPQAPRFGEPMIYQMHPDAPSVGDLGNTYVEVHESRLIRFGGIKVSRRQMRANNGWGDSILVRIKAVLSNFHQTWGSASILMQDFAQAVLKINGLADLIATNQDDVIAKRAQALDMSRSVARMFLIDSEEDFERKATPMTGMPEMLEKFALRLAAAAGMPVSLLFGQAPAGLNATGSSDIRFFYDQIAALQRHHLQPKLQRIVRLLMKTRGSSTGNIEPSNWSIQFNPLWQLDDSQMADVRLKQAQADLIYLQNGVTSASEIAVSRFGGDEWSGKTTIDFEGRSALADVPPPVPLRSKVPEIKPAASFGGGFNGGPT